MTNKLARKRCYTWLLLIAIGFVSGGASCPRRAATLSFPPPPAVLTQAPGLSEIAAAVNRTSVVRELSSNTASVQVLSMGSIPTLSATLALRRDKNFRLRASIPIVMGTALDMGSNSDLFWFEVPEDFGKTLYYARHDQYQRQLDRAVLPVDPTWVMDALGLMQLDPANVVAGPVMRPDGKLEIRSTLPMAAGVFQRVCYVDAQYGHVTDQLLFAPNGQQIAKSTATRHQFYADQQCSLPHSVRLELTPAGGEPLSLQIDVGTYVINQILSGDPNLFVMPQTAGNAVDLTTIGPGPVPAAALGTPASPVGYKTNEIGPLPYRGLVQPLR